MSNVLTDTQAMDYIAANVARLRGERTRYWLAKTVGISPIQVTRIEERNNLPRAGLLARLAEVLGVSVDDLLTPPESPKKNSRKSA